MRAAALAGALALATALGACVAPAVREQPQVPAARPPDAPVEEPRPLATLIAQAPDLGQFRALTAAGGLDRLLAGRAAVTVLAPTDAAFGRLPAGTVEALLQPGNRPSLLHLLRFWVVPIVDNDSARLPTLDGETVTLTAQNGTTILVDAAGRRGYIVHRTSATDGVLLELNGIVAPRSIEPGAPGLTRR